MGRKLGRYSLLGCDPLWILEAKGDKSEDGSAAYRTTQTHRDGSQVVFTGDPFTALAECLAPYHPVKLPQLPSGIGGLFGFWGYELIHWIEPRVPIHAQDERNIPDGLWMQVDHLLVFDQVKRKIWAIAYADLRDPKVDLEAAYQKASDRVTEMVSKLSLPLSPQNTKLDWTPPANQAKRGYRRIHQQLYPPGILRQRRKSQRIYQSWRYLPSRHFPALIHRIYRRLLLHFTVLYARLILRLTWLTLTSKIGKSLVLVQK